jgi:hypothetical protein
MKHIGPIAVIGLADMVDELAALKAQVAPIEQRMEWLKDQLKSANVPADEKGTKRIDGTEHTAVITLSTPQVLDRERLRADLGDDIWGSYLSEGKLTATCKLTARKVR